MSQAQVVTADQVEPDVLAAFLNRVYPALKSSFLNRHGAWWHHGQSNRLVLLMDGKPVGYCGVIPVRVRVAGGERSALWWVDLMIAPEYRGRALQSLFDERVREMSDLLLGFPNEVAIKIHRKHGWGVREDMPILMLPLWPTRVKMVRSAQGREGWIRRAAAVALSPLAALWRLWLMLPAGGQTWKMRQLEPRVLAEVFQRAPQNELNTTGRAAEYFAWRYGQAPDRGEYAFYLAGPREAPTHVLIARFVTPAEGPRYARILDVFGDFGNTHALRGLFHHALQDSVRHGAGQVTVLASRPELQRLARRLGFFFSSPVGFCWLCNDPSLMESLAGDNYWVLADSDNDPPD
jgi:hypothetical protein